MTVLHELQKIYLFLYIMIYDIIFALDQLYNLLADILIEEVVKDSETDERCVS